jgi:hypothetical protein
MKKKSKSKIKGSTKFYFYYLINRSLLWRLIPKHSDSSTRTCVLVVCQSCHPVYFFVSPIHVCQIFYGDSTSFCDSFLSVLDVFCVLNQVPTTPSEGRLMGTSLSTQVIYEYNLGECGLKVMVVVRGGGRTRAVYWFSLSLWVPHSLRREEIDCNLELLWRRRAGASYTLRHMREQSRQSLT